MTVPPYLGAGEPIAQKRGDVSKGRGVTHLLMRGPVVHGAGTQRIQLFPDVSHGRVCTSALQGRHVPAKLADIVVHIWRGAVRAKLGVSSPPGRFCVPGGTGKVLVLGAHVVFIPLTTVLLVDFEFNANMFTDPYRSSRESLYKYWGSPRPQWKAPQGPRPSVREFKGMIPVSIIHQPFPPPRISASSPRVQAVPTLDLDRNLPASVKRILADMNSDKNSDPQPNEQLYIMHPKRPLEWDEDASRGAKRLKLHRPVLFAPPVLPPAAPPVTTRAARLRAAIALPDERPLAANAFQRIRAVSEASTAEKGVPKAIKAAAATENTVTSAATENTVTLGILNGVSCGRVPVCGYDCSWGVCPSVCGAGQSALCTGLPTFASERYTYACACAAQPPGARGPPPP